jgi:hypothetical protein
MPPGHNGPYCDPETPIRNTAHWAMIFLFSYQSTGEAKFFDSATAAIEYLKQSIHTSGDVAFNCRAKAGKDQVNGLIGQAWALEPLAYLHRIRPNNSDLQLALDVIKSHSFDRTRGLWNKTTLDGGSDGLDLTFNHQLWFASVAAMFCKYDETIADCVNRFLDKMMDNLNLHSSGRIGQAVYINWYQSVFKQAIKKVLRRDSIEYMKLKEVGYHAFNTLAFSRLYRVFPDLQLWHDGRFIGILDYLNSEEYKGCIFESNYGFPYNPPGLEVAATMFAFPEQVDWDIHFVNELFDFQIQNCWNSDTHLLELGLDKHTSAARIYEAIACSDDWT